MSNDHSWTTAGACTPTTLTDYGRRLAPAWKPSSATCTIFPLIKDTCARAVARPPSSSQSPQLGPEPMPDLEGTLLREHGGGAPSCWAT
eukprot:6374986-Pyramimonas_sp.AAC.1